MLACMLGVPLGPLGLCTHRSHLCSNELTNMSHKSRKVKSSHPVQPVPAADVVIIGAGLAGTPIAKTIFKKHLMKNN